MIFGWVSDRLLKGTRLRLVAASIFVLVFFWSALHRLPGSSTAAHHYSVKDRKSETPLKKRQPLTNHVAPQPPDLQDISVIHHGRIVEVKGGTDPGAIVMINGERAATFFDGNRFKYFLGPMSLGTTVITITAQNDLGGVTTRRLAVTID